MQSDIRDILKKKQKIDQNKESVKPTVINDVLIREYLIQYNKENSIFDDDEKPIWELTHLSLSYKSKSLFIPPFFLPIESVTDRIHIWM